ncbi:hypothetical protein DERF_015908 [Dermatophagoides farinae]|uniref:Uncharacterized protein n=1 Tax=Dermatophagoides farinae TaxID=6954 RepID=A0A922HFM0_DERFA|nr:hypothetical protein HUG17_3879 [Dermatophagoides farinae]KAH9491176.1 hypothetical protein DERF_015908 [Dermatophagoides farinae]
MMTSKRELANRLDRLENRFESLCSLMNNLLKITDNKDDGNLSSIRQMTSNQLRNRFGEWLFNDSGRWSQINRIIDRPSSTATTISIPMARVAISGGNDDQDQGYKSLSPNIESQRQPTIQQEPIAHNPHHQNVHDGDGNNDQRKKHIIYQLIFETIEPMILAGFLSSDMMLLFNNPLFTIIRTRPEKMIIFLECQHTVQDFLAHCHYDPSKGCWQLSVRNLPPIKITLERSIYYD